MALTMVAALSAGVAPSLPAAYTAHLTWGECGNQPPCTMPSDNRTTWTDGESAMNHYVFTVPKLGSMKYHELWTSDGHQYTWHDQAADCTSEDYPTPIQSDWIWLTYNTTMDGGSVPCPNEPSKQCHLYSGPWPEQLTQVVKLWLVDATTADGIPTPVHLEMTCSLFPFTIFKNFTSVHWGVPPRADLTPDASCKNATTAAAQLPRSREEALILGHAGPYTNLLRRAIAQKWVF